ncbi:uncharacterized protein P884DRAFT_272496 [Thermothelomyces heterothallicus CBS 202.75]|uniref:uncharacterized protein n=1 Tax=Thermothelomyces heterothallicus CBS 202.75 TaxID=1149848 RepID=UPI00374365D3
MATIESPFDLPLRRDSDTLDTWPELKQAYLARFAPSVDESTLNKEELNSRVEAWKGVIQEKQSANPRWTTRWLRSYGTTLFKVLSYAQLAAMLDMAYDPERLDCWRQKPELLLAAKLCPALVFYYWNYPSHDRKAARESLRSNLAETRKLDRARTWEDYRPGNRSPLRNVWTPVDLAGDIQGSAELPQFLTPSSEFDACPGLVSNGLVDFLTWQTMLLRRYWRTKRVRKPERAQRCFQFLALMVRELHTMTALPTAAQTAALLVPMSTRKTAGLLGAARNLCQSSDLLQPSHLRASSGQPPQTTRKTRPTSV